MPNLSDTAISQPSSRRLSATKRLIQAAALASALVPLGAVAVDGAVINCISDGGGSGSNNCGSGGGQGSYSSGSGTNTWKFFQSGFFDYQTQTTVYQGLLYTVEIFGDPTSDFTINVHDVVFTQGTTIDLTAFPGAECIPIFDDNNCAYFPVEVLSGSPSWADGYYTMLITWFTNADPISQPPITADNRILKAPGGVAFTQSLIDSEYDPAPTPTDPALGGRGDTFSNFVPTTNATSAPEPTTLMLFGTALGAALIRRRRNR